MAAEFNLYPPPQKKVKFENTESVSIFEQIVSIWFYPLLFFHNYRIFKLLQNHWQWQFENLLAAEFLEAKKSTQHTFVIKYVIYLLIDM